MRGFLLLCGLALGTVAHNAVAAEASVLMRNYFLHNDDRNDRVREQSYKQEWAQGFIGRFDSGYTAGWFGVGAEAHGFVGLRLDSGRGTAGTGLLPLDSDGRAEPEYSSAGAALKLRLGETQLKVGEMEVETPVFDTADKRLQPEYASGWLLDSLEVPGVRLVAGHFTAFKNQNQSSGHGDFEGYEVSTAGHAVSLAGVESRSDLPVNGSLYMGELSDTWRQYYANLHGAHPLGNDTRMLWDANLYRTLDTGAASGGAIATTATSLMLKLRHQVQTVGLGYQKVHGETPFDFVGGDSIYLANSIKYNDFNGAGEQSWQVRYDRDLTELLPGLSVMGRYVRGSGIDTANGEGKHWERDLTLAYTAPSGPAKDLSLELSYVTHRGNAAQGNNDLDRVYIIVQYPWDITGR
ncbi:OprD family porin [Pseudomonas sp. 3A(2025)]